MGNALQGVGKGVGIVVHRIDAPLIAGAVMGGPADAVDRGVAHIEVGRCHINLGPQHMGAVGKLSGAHPAEQVQVFRRRALAVRAFPAGFGQGAAIVADFLGGKAVHIGFAGLNQLFGKGVQGVEVVGGVVKMRPPVEAQPAHILLNGLDILDVLPGRVGVVKAQMADAAGIFGGDAEVQADGFGVADVQVAVGFRRKAGNDAAAILVGLQVGLNDAADKVDARSRVGSGHNRLLPFLSVSVQGRDGMD